MRTTINAISRGIRESTPPGSTWWTDISHAFVPDFDGNCYGRIFAEEHTSYALEYYCADKTTAALVKQLTSLQS